MPPPKNKLYAKTGKLKTLNSVRSHNVPPSGPISSVVPPPPATPSSSAADNEAERQLELELCWCIQTMETSLASGLLNAKQAQDTDKTIKILKSSTQPVVKKRMVMRTAFGDYRALMADEERKLRLKNQQIQFTPKAQTSAFFVKKSALLASGANFRFDFPVADLQQLDLNETNTATGNGSDVAEVSSVVGGGHKPKAPTATIGASDNSFKFNFSIDAD